MISYRTFSLTLLAVSCAVTLSACGSSSPARFYTLSPGATPLPAAVQPLDIPIHVAPASLPDMVDRPQMVMVVDSNQIKLMEGHRWAEPLKSAIPRILADNLSRILAADRISWHPQTPPYRSMYTIAVDFRKFETSERQVAIDALWSIRKTDSAALITGRSTISQQLAGNGAETMAAGYSKALETLSLEIAAVLGREINEKR